MVRVLPCAWCAGAAPHAAAAAGVNTLDQSTTAERPLVRGRAFTTLLAAFSSYYLQCVSTVPIDRSALLKSLLKKI